MFTRKLTRIAGETRPDDFVVLRDGLVVGRIYASTLTNPTRKAWLWFKQTIPGRQGHAETYEEAAEQLKVALLADQGGLG